LANDKLVEVADACRDEFSRVIARRAGAGHVRRDPEAGGVLSRAKNHGQSIFGPASDSAAR